MTALSFEDRVKMMENYYYFNRGFKKEDKKEEKKDKKVVDK